MTTMLEKAIARQSCKKSQERVLTEEAIDFLCELHHFDSERLSLLERRQERQAGNGILPDFSGQNKAVRESEWKVAPAPHDLNDRRVEITGSVSAR
ncbi:MAG: hypothetical protein R3D26_07855 [Cyanobacteriota/Melainabacteria group bacterium]